MSTPSTTRECCGFCLTEGDNFSSYCENPSCTCHKQTGSWEDSLYYDVLEDYIREAELSYALRNGKDKEYYERMRGHLEKLESFIRSLLQAERNKFMGELRKVVEAVAIGKEKTPFSMGAKSVKETVLSLLKGEELTNN